MHLYISYAERSRVSKPSSCPPIEIGKRGLSLNSTGLEVYGKGTDFEQRQNTTGGTMDMDGGMRGGRAKRDSDRARA